MPSIFMLGDSHVAALEKGWETVQSDFLDVQITFMATPGQRGRDFIVSEGRLTAGSDTLKNFFRRAKTPDASVGPGFDLYFTCGLGLQINQFPDARRAFVSAARQERAASARDDLFEGMCQALRKSTCGETLSKLREITKAPIGVIPPPMPSVRVLKPTFQHLASIDSTGIFAKTFLEACEVVAREFAAVFIPQPAQTLSQVPLGTDTRFEHGPVKFFVYNLEDDGRHMNAAYGEIVLRNALNTMLGREGAG